MTKTVKGVFYVSLHGGYCGLLEARTLQSATKLARELNGTSNLQSVRPATRDDVQHIRAMGGWVPEVCR